MHLLEHIDQFVSVRKQHPEDDCTVCSQTGTVHTKICHL
jgi:hypothetical protein